MSPHQHKSLPYRPALDGLRGVAVLAVVIYHLQPNWLPGGWLGVDLFFVLSGFLITSLLLVEHDRWGSISLSGFWISRARRLLPSLVTMLATVLIVSRFWTIPSRRGAVAADGLAALFYVANWRLLLSDDQYFNTLSLPSPLRHTWSLAIEEQYYFLYPLLLALLLFVTLHQGARRRRVVLFTALAAIAALSVWRMSALYIPGVDPSRVYYGTDTRIFELLIGALAAVLVSRSEFERDEQPRTAIWRALPYAGLAALPLLVIGFVVIRDNAAITFQGALLGFCLLATLPIVAAASPSHNRLQPLLGWEPLRRIGLISYSLYLWHYPVIVFLSADRMGFGGVGLSAVQAAVSAGCAYLAYRYIETPIRRGGVKALLPRRRSLSVWVTGLAVPVLAIGALYTVTTSNADAAAPASSAVGSADGGSVKVPVGNYTPGKDFSVTLVGNSIPASLAAAFQQSAQPNLTLTTSVNYGCDPYVGNRVVSGNELLPSADCAAWRSKWTAPIQSARPTVAVFMVPQTLTHDIRVNGKTLQFGSAGFTEFVRSTLDDLRRAALGAGATKFAVTSLACHRTPFADGNTEFQEVNDDSRVASLNKVITAWGKSSGSAVFDLDSLLCTGGFHSSINGTPLYKDGLHYTAQSGAIIWSWLAPQLQKVADQ
ncbi:acyltransferase family protein [Calidifontibacter terrae]